MLTFRPLALRPPAARSSPVRESSLRAEPPRRHSRWGAYGSRRIRGGVAALGFVLAGFGVWMWPPSSVTDVRTIPTGAGFNVTVARSQDDAYAMSIANRVEAAGLPAFTRGLGKGRSRQVVVGPYVSIDEAESVQRMLARRGFGARLLVDESVRRVQGGHAEVVRTGGGVTPLLIAGGGRLAVVIEMPVEPRRVITRDPDSVAVDSVAVDSVRVDSVRRGGPSGPPSFFTTLEIDAGPVPGTVNSGRWNAPAGVALFHNVSIEHVASAEGPSIRIRMDVSKFAGSNVRVAGRRLYVDLWPLEGTREPARVVRMVETRERVVEDYRMTIRPAVEKFDAIEPFVLSALGSPTPEVLTALRRTLQGLDQWMRTVRPPRQWQDAHYSLVAAINLTAEALSPGFTGDRAARVGEGFARHEQVKVMLDDALPATN